jgi:hypothetical protein
VKKRAGKGYAAKVVANGTALTDCHLKGKGVCLGDVHLV